MVGILALGLPLGRILRRGVEELVPAAPKALRLGADGLADGIAITLAATAATAPILGHHFGSVPLAGLPANLLALPAVAPAMWLGMLKIAAGQVGAPHAVAEALGALAARPVGLIALAGRALRRAVAQPALPAAGLARGGRRRLRCAGVRRPGAAPRRSPAHAACARGALAVAAPPAVGAGGAGGRARRRAVLAFGWLLRAPAGPDRLTVRFLDVGQGDATLIQHPDGTAVLFDGGPPEAGVARLLRRAGVRRLALVVATHASRDHQGGLVEVLRRFGVDALLDGGDGTRDAGFTAVLREAAARGVRRIRATAPLTLGLAGGRLRIEVLSPEPRPPGPAPEDPNPRGVVAIVSSGWFDLFLSADAESDALLGLDLPDVDAMKVPHHGSADAGLAQVLDELEPRARCDRGRPEHLRPPDALDARSA